MEQCWFQSLDRFACYLVFIDTPITRAPRAATVRDLAITNNQQFDIKKRSEFMCAQMILLYTIANNRVVSIKCQFAG